MSVLIVSENRLFLEGTLAELEENGIFADASGKIADGYSTVLVDIDSVPYYGNYEGNVITLSHSEKCDIPLPCSAREIISAIKRLEGDFCKESEKPSQNEEKNENVIAAISLTQNEKKILSLLLATPGTSVPCSLIEEKVFQNVKRGSNIVSVYMTFLRRKLEEVSGRKIIGTERGKGYFIRKDAVEFLKMLQGERSQG